MANSRGKATDTFYEVRLDSWNCSCAAFAFAAFALLGVEEGGGGNEGGDPVVGMGVNAGEAEAGGAGDCGRGAAAALEEEERERGGFRFGGTATKPDAVVPVCKHILAAAVARSLPDFAMPPGREQRGWKREVSGSELAGWGAGWGDRG